MHKNQKKILSNDFSVTDLTLLSLKTYLTSPLISGSITGFDKLSTIRLIETACRKANRQVDQVK